MEIFLKSDAFSILLTVFGIVILTWIFKSKNKKWAGLPPGPPKLPLLGNLLQMVKDPHLKFSQWAKQYGNLYTVYFANKPALVVSDLKMLRELFGMPAATGKFKTDTLLLLSQGPHGILNTEGKNWQEQRQFYMRNLKQFGCGTNGNFEKAVINEAEEVCQWILETRKTCPRNTVKINLVLNPAISNTLWTVTSGERIPLKNSRIEYLLRTTLDYVQRTMKTGLGFFPWIKNVTPELSGYNGLDRACKEMHKFVETSFEKHKEAFVEGQNRDLMDAYIEHWKSMSKNSESSFCGKVGWKNCVSAIAEIFIAGGENSSNTVHWTLIYLSKHLDVQKKLQQEIDDVIGRDRMPSISDRTRMSYAEAVILETFRYSSEAPFGAFHELLEDTSFHGYELPKGLILVANMYHVHHNPEIWTDPENFRPERFLENPERTEELKRSVIPFQIGKRQCPGEPLARDILFLFVTKLFQQFSVGFDPAIKSEEYLKPDVGIILKPQSFGLVMTPR